MITYLLKSGLLLLVFYAVYKLWLENEKMFRFNRVYLITTFVFSLVVPLQLISFQSYDSTRKITVQLDEVVIQKSSENLKSILENLNLGNIILSIYSIVVLVLTIRFLLNLLSFYKKAKRSEMQFINGEKIILVNESTLPHSFWNFIFINKEEFKNGKISSELIAHEKAHLDQKHTLDILFIEFLQIIFWFNPLVVLYKKAIKLNHEFLADDAVNNQFGEVKKYQFLLLEIASNKTNIILASNINYLITKKRFLMMTKKESPARIILKVFSIGIISSLLLFVFSCKDNPEENNTKKQSETEKSSVGVEEKSTFPDEDDTVRSIAGLEQKPEFPGGIEQFYKFVGENYKAPEEEGLKGKVYVTFVVEKDGSLSELKVIRDIGYGTGEEAIRVLKLCPNWNPGKIKNKPVRTLYSLPITIQTAD
ncbi:M56 family metallopeptidase [Flavobacterium sp. 5]|uniref:M56 family metallopeptidase n=1 Tax=Flavobacterium sp. 5 TaxID=2035199 RepID=UPI000C2BCAA3|nr:M56 family metallopeptidase [Flavobacterium sp. 5]PKB17068.1 TonB-like protein [Flavobacterium sp. 5]